MASAKSTPKDAQVMAAILKDMGITEYEPRIINQMLEFTYRYVTDVLDDAKIYSSHAKKKSPDVEDVKLAVQCRLDHSFTTPPPRDLLLELARHKNSTSLPLIKPFTGPKLPPDRYTLTAPNYRLKIPKKATTTRFQIQNGSMVSTLLPAPKISIQPSPGATLVRAVTAGTPMSIITRGLTQPTMTVRTTTAGPAPTPGGVPIIRLQPGLSHPGGMTSMSLLQTPDGALKRKREDDDYDKL